MRLLFALATVGLLVLTAGCLGTVVTHDPDPNISTDVIDCDDQESDCTVEFTVISLGGADSVIIETDNDTTYRLADGETQTVDVASTTVTIYAESNGLAELKTVYHSAGDLPSEGSSDD